MYVYFEPNTTGPFSTHYSSAAIQDATKWYSSRVFRRIRRLKRSVRWIVLKDPNLKHFVAAEIRQSGYTINRAIDQLPNGLAVMITAQGGHFELRFY